MVQSGLVLDAITSSLLLVMAPSMSTVGPTHAVPRKGTSSSWRDVPLCLCWGVCSMLVEHCLTASDAADCR